MSRSRGHGFHEYAVQYPASMDGSCGDLIKEFGEDEEAALAFQQKLRLEYLEHRRGNISESEWRSVRMLKRFVFRGVWEKE